MTTSVTIDEIQTQLREVIHTLAPGDEVIITDQEIPVAILAAPALPTSTPIAGRGKGVLTILAEDEEHLADFKEYFP